MQEQEHTLEEIFEKYGKHSPVSSMREATVILSNFVEDMRNKHSSDVTMMLKEVKSSLSPYLCEDEAREYLENIKNEDGSHGPHWSKEQTDEVARKYSMDLDGEMYNDWDFYVAMNLVYSDMYQSVFQLDNYVKLTKSMWLCDKDWVKDGKQIPGKIKWYVSEKHEYLD